jgi:hypothetical protein
MTHPDYAILRAEGRICATPLPDYSFVRYDGQVYMLEESAVWLGSPTELRWVCGR